MTGAAPALSVEELGLVYPPPRRVVALQDVNLTIPPGEFVAIVGHNGSGKTTLARCVSGYLAPTAGRVRVHGRDIHAMPAAARSTLVGYVFQNPDHQLFKDTVWEDVAFGLQNLGLPRGEVLRRSEDALQGLGLWEKRELHPFRLSKGDRQRLAIAAIVVMRPRVLVVDEPTTGQDAEKSREIMELLLRVNAETGTTVLIITHAMDLVAEYGRRVVVMAGGRVLLDGAPRQVLAETELLRRSRISPPPIVRLGVALGLDPLPLTVAEAREAILRACRR